MKQNFRIFAALLISAACLGLIPALAEDSQQQMPMMGQNMMGGQGMMSPFMMGQSGMGMMGSDMHGMMGQGMMTDIGPVLEGRLAYMKAELGITTEQSVAWDDYAKAVKTRVASLQETRAEMMKIMHSGSAIERLDARTKAMENMVEGLKAVRPATEALYNSLSEDQKKKADALLGMGCCMI